MATIGENIKRIRKSKKLTQVQLSKLSGVSQSGISEVEKTVNSPSATTLSLLADALGCTISDFIEGTEKETDIKDSLVDEVALILRGFQTERQKQVLDYVRYLSKNE